MAREILRGKMQEFVSVGRLVEEWGRERQIVITSDSDVEEIDSSLITFSCTIVNLMEISTVLMKSKKDMTAVAGRTTQVSSTYIFENLTLSR